MNAPRQQNIQDVISLVNANSGNASVRLRFNDDLPPVDFVANSGFLRGDGFVFTAGYETFEGRVDELAEIQAEVIKH